MPLEAHRFLFSSIAADVFLNYSGYRMFTKVILGL